MRRRLDEHRKDVALLLVVLELHCNLHCFGKICLTCRILTCLDLLVRVKRNTTLSLSLEQDCQVYRLQINL